MASRTGGRTNVLVNATGLLELGECMPMPKVQDTRRGFDTVSALDITPTPETVARSCGKHAG